MEAATAHPALPAELLQPPVLWGPDGVLPPDARTRNSAGRRELQRRRGKKKKKERRKAELGKDSLGRSNIA